MGLRVSVGILSFDYIPASPLFLSLRDVFSFSGVSGSRRRVSFNTTVFLVLVDPMLCLLNLPLSAIRRIKSKSISDLEEGLCTYDPSPFSLVPELWVRSRGVLRY